MSKTPKPYFVYELIDPRDGKPFYVGKGSGDRPAQHMREAASGRNSHKCNKIRAIQAVGAEVGVSIVRRFRSEDAAYRFEKRHIAKIGLGNLTNICPGGRGNVSSDPDLAEIDLIATCARKTAGFTVMPKLNLFGQVHEVGSVLADVGQKLIAKLAKKRGNQWVIDSLAKKNIALRFIQNNGAINAV